MAGKTVTLAVEVDEKRRAEAEKVLQSYGLTMSIAVNVLLRRIVEDQTLPLELKVPNAATRAAIAQSRKSMAEMRAHMDAVNLEEDSPG